MGFLFFWVFSFWSSLFFFCLKFYGFGNCVGRCGRLLEIKQSREMPRSKKKESDAASQQRGPPLSSSTRKQKSKQRAISGLELDKLTKVVTRNSRGGRGLIPGKERLGHPGANLFRFAKKKKGRGRVLQPMKRLEILRNTK